MDSIHLQIGGFIYMVSKDPPAAIPADKPGSSIRLWRTRNRRKAPVLLARFEGAFLGLPLCGKILTLNRLSLPF